MTKFRHRFVPGYDLFKLLVAVMLVIILIVLSLWSRRGAFKSQVTDIPSLTPTVVQISTPLATKTQLPLPTSSPQPDTPAPTFTSQPVMPTETPVESIETPTPLPPTSEPTQLAGSGCPSAESRIKIGDHVRVLLRLNFRKGPGLEYPIIQTNRIGTDLQVIGGPICTVKPTSTGSRAYLWWNVRMENGMEGWSAEAPLVNAFYFLDPVK